MSGSGEGESSASIPSQLAMLVPSFDPSKDELLVYQQKVQLVLSVWPTNKISELITRLILNTTGSAFAKLQLHHEELCINDPKGVQKLIELLGGHWGRIGLARKFRRRRESLVSMHAEGRQKSRYVSRSCGHSGHSVDEA